MKASTGPRCGRTPGGGARGGAAVGTRLEGVQADIENRRRAGSGAHADDLNAGFGYGADGGQIDAAGGFKGR